MGSLVEDITTIAKKNLSDDGYLCPIFFLVKDEMIIAPPIPCNILFDKKLNAEDAKSFAVFKMGVLARAYKATRLIMIWDAAMRTMPKDGNYDATDAPLTFPKSMRTECIIVNDINLQSGKDKTCIVPYKGGDGEPVEFLPDEDYKDMPAESRFTELALEGYNKEI